MKAYDYLTPDNDRSTAALIAGVDPARVHTATLGSMERDTAKLTLDEIHARMGMEITPEGKADARRRRLDSAAANRDPEGTREFLAALRSRTA